MRENRYLTQNEAIKLLRTSASTIIRWRKKGYIKASQIGGKILYDTKEIERILDNN